MKRALFISIVLIFISFSLQQSNDTGEAPENSNITDSLIDTLSNYTGDAASIVLDFIPYIGNVKGLVEAVSGMDLIMGKNLTDVERMLSLIAAIPFANFLKGGKNYKVGHSFLKASERAFSGGKLKNYIKFGKASARAFAKPNVMQKIAKAGTLVAKEAKSLSKGVREYNKK